MTQPLTNDQLEELLEAVIPCEACGSEATLMSRGHGCRPASFGCIPCYQQWIFVAMAILARQSIVCIVCNRAFHSVAEFSDWRPF